MSFNVFRENKTLAEISRFTVGTEYFTGCFCLFEVLYPSQQLWSVHLTWHSLLFEVGAQWLSGRALDSRPKGRGFEPHRRHCVVSLSKNINPSLVLVQPRKIRPFITERMLMGRKELNQTNKNKLFEAVNQYFLHILKLLVTDNNPS